MKIKIIKKGPGCNLEVGEVYDLADMSAKTLISNGQAAIITTIAVKIAVKSAAEDEPIDFSHYSNEELADFAAAANLSVQITNPETIIKHLIATGFDPNASGADEGDQE